MTKQEQIEGIAKYVDDLRIDYPPSPKEVAEVLYNEGYRKISDKCVVMTKDDLEIYKKQAVKEFADKLKERLSKGSCCYITNFKSPTDEFAYNAKEVEK